MSCVTVPPRKADPRFPLLRPALGPAELSSQRRLEIRVRPGRARVGLYAFAAEQLVRERITEADRRRLTDKYITDLEKAS